MLKIDKQYYNRSVKETENKSINPSEVFMLPSRSFLFIPEKQEFIVGNSAEKQSVKLSEVKCLNDVEYNVRDLKSDIGFDNSEMLLISPLGTLIETVNLRKILANLNTKSKHGICKQTQSTIAQVYKAFNPYAKIERNLFSKNSTFVISANIFDFGIFLLKSIGNYATMEASPHQGLPFYSINYRDNHLQETELENIELPLEYGMHNIDYHLDKREAAAQELSLFAGAGTIAYLAKNGLPDNK